MRILVTGGAGFIGSHLVDRLIENEKNEVIVVDNYFTGSKDNLKKWMVIPDLSFLDMWFGLAISLFHEHLLNTLQCRLSCSILWTRRKMLRISSRRQVIQKNSGSVVVDAKQVLHVNKKGAFCARLPLVVLALPRRVHCRGR